MALSLLLQEIVSLWLNLPGYFLSLTIQWTPEDYCSVLPSFLKRLSFHNSVSVALFSKPLAHAVTMNQFIITATSPPGLLNAVYDQHSNIVVLFFANFILFPVCLQVPSHSLSQLYTEGDPQACSIANLTTGKHCLTTDMLT